MDHKVRVLMTDDNAVMLMGLQQVISVDPELEPVGSAENGEEALERYRTLQPDVVTMDYDMPGWSGVETTAKIIREFPDARIILLSVFESEEDVWSAVQAGVKGYLTKKAGEIEDVLEAIHEVAAGGTFFPAAIARKIETRRNQPELSGAEMAVLRLLGRGLCNKEIVDELGISAAMVKFHIVNLREKLGAADRTQAVIIACQRGLIRLEE
ncbi:response regulator transcription factor [Pontiella agarivorans]|uniref:Response regulator transcription factor n=1 Tax=Pontiella agarivorans TaxID=3038953 RepID=A0ABU5MU83_9BACT|nr:response regulator transcription factor [Pontiella agarivorans]MDZ8117707.1 response regulator transcription factor [Pontiella agarivorans]